VEGGKACSGLGGRERRETECFVVVRCIWKGSRAVGGD